MSRVTLSVVVGLGLCTLLMAVSPAVLGAAWLKLDDPPSEGGGDSAMTATMTDGFEGGTLSQWTEGGALKWQTAGSRRHSGSASAFVNGGGGLASTMTSIAIDVSGSVRRNVTFWWQLSANTPSLRLSLHVNDGTQANDVWVKRTVDADNTWHKATVDLSAYSAIPTLRLTFEFFGGSGSDKAWIDDLAVARDHPAADIVDLYFGNDGVSLLLQETLASSPRPDLYTYTVYIDKPTDGAIDPDFRVIYTTGKSALQKWNVSLWEDVAPVQVLSGASNLTFTIPLSALSNPDLLQDTDLYFANLLGVLPSPSPALLANPPAPPPGVDHASDQGKLHIPRNNVPQIPLWPTLPIFLSALAIVVALGARRFGLWGRRGF